MAQGNFIGTDVTGSLDLANGLEGISFQSGAGDIVIGGTGPGAGNTIAFNNAEGIRIRSGSGSGVQILQNEIYSNAGLGINLSGGTENAGKVTANDVGDGDTGVNNLQNFPDLSGAVTTGSGSIHIAGSLNSSANHNFRIEFFASPMADGSGYGEGQTYLGSVIVMTDINGNATIAASLSATVAAGQFITATATDVSHTLDTSEFGLAVQATGSLAVTTTSDVADGDTSSIAGLIANPGADGRISLREAILAANNTAGADDIVFALPVTDAGHFYYTDDGIANQVSIGNVTATTAASDAALVGADPDFAKSWWSIQVGAAGLPSITTQVTIDGTTQTGYSGTPIVELDGSLTAAGESGLAFSGAAADGSVVRGLVINQFDGQGIDLFASNGNTIEGNFIGTDVSGTADLGNTDKGIRITSGAANNIIGGTNASARNLISGNDGDGIRITVGSLNNQVLGNYIGTDVTGTVALGNTGYGVLINSAAVSNTLGGTAAGAGNLISGNQTKGVGISGAGTDGNLVQGNFVGTDVTGTLDLGNAGTGVWLANSAAGNTIGGTAAGAGNLVAFSGAHGIDILDTAGAGNSLLGNSVHSSVGLGIDLNNDDLPTSNDDPDVDGLQNFPVITSAETTGGQITISGTIRSTANSYFRVEFFANTINDPTGYGEGQRYLGFANVATDGSGDGSFSELLIESVAAGEFISATATNCDAMFATFGNTSEFGLSFAATPPNTAPVITSDGGGATAAVNVSENNTAVTTVTATDADLPAQTLTYAIAGGADAAFFAIDVNTGALTFLAGPTTKHPPMPMVTTSTKSPSRSVTGP